MSNITIAILAIASLALLLNLACTYVLWREGFFSPSQSFPSEAPEALTDGDPAGRGGSAPAASGLLDLPPHLRLCSNRDLTSGLHSERQLHLLKVVGVDHHPFTPAGVPPEGDFGQGDRNVAEVRDLDADGPLALGECHQGDQAHPHSHSVPANHPPCVEDTKRGAYDGNSKSGPANPVHLTPPVDSQAQSTGRGGAR